MQEAAILPGARVRAGSPLAAAAVRVAPAAPPRRKGAEAADPMGSRVAGALGWAGRHRQARGEREARPVAALQRPGRAQVETQEAAAPRAEGVPVAAASVVGEAVTPVRRSTAEPWTVRSTRAAAPLHLNAPAAAGRA